VDKGSFQNSCVVVLAVMGIGFVVLLVGALGVLLSDSVLRKGGTPPATARIADDDEEWLEAERRVFVPQKPLVEAEAERELMPLFDDLGRALREADGTSINAHFDLACMADEYAALVAFPFRSPQAKRDFMNGARTGFGQARNTFVELRAWNTSEIHKVKKLSDVTVVVIARHRNPNGTSQKMRWWVTRRFGTWKIYDLEDLDVGLRMSTVMGSLAEQGRAMLGQPRLDMLPEAAVAAQNLKAAQQALDAQQNPNAAEQLLALVPAQRLPPPIEVLRHQIKGLIHLRRGQFQDALNAFEAAKRIQPDAPVLDHLQGTTLTHLNRWAEALEYLQAYRDLLGEDADTCRVLGVTLNRLGRYSEAVQLFRRALDFNPKDTRAFQGLLRSLTSNDKLDDVGARFALLETPAQFFDEFAEECEKREFPQLLEPLVQAMRDIAPRHVSLDYYLALVQARKRHPKEALPLFKSALAKQKDALKRREYAKRFLKAMGSIGKADEGYAVIPDSRAMFPGLAAEAKKHYRIGDLRQLVQVHGKKHADDPLLPWYQAELYVREGRYALADQTFAAALAHPPDAETLKEFRGSRVLAQYHTGRALSAYRDVGPRQETFTQLAILCFNNEEDAQLRGLLDAHEKHNPRDDELLRFRYRLKIRQQQTAEAVKLFKSALARPTSKEKRTERVSEFLSDMVNAGQALEGYKAAPDAKEAFSTIAEQLQEEGRLEELKPILGWHRRSHPNDPWLAYFQGEIHVQEKAWDQALAALEKGMKQAPKDVRNRFRWQYVYAGYEAGSALKVYEASDAKKETFTQLANLMANDKKGAELQALVEAHRPQAKDDPELFYQEARAKVFLNQPQEAIALFKHARGKQPTETQRNQCEYGFFWVMADAGHAMTAYQAAPDKVHAFDVLASRLLALAKEREKELVALLQEHRQNHGKDSLTRYFEGELDLVRRNYDRASQCLKAALADCLPKDQWRIRQAFFRARVKAGQAVAAYRENVPGTTFASLASLCVQEKDGRQLQALLDVHRQTNPDESNLESWELDVLWLNKDYQGVLKLLADRSEAFTQSWHKWKARNHRVRCLVKLKRFDEAVKAAEAAVKNNASNPLLLVLAHAAAGNVEKAIAALGTKRLRHWVVRNFYQDDDLGPILRSEPFKAFREKYPEPKEK
jgi:tetratricopeptide (TPR) repeat protein